MDYMISLITKSPYTIKQKGKFIEWFEKQELPNELKIAEKVMLSTKELTENLSNIIKELGLNNDDESLNKLEEESLQRICLMYLRVNTIPENIKVIYESVFKQLKNYLKINWL